MRVVRTSDGAVVVRELELADTFATRLRGLMGRRSFEDGRGLWLEPCSSIQMMFVRFPIDVLFLRREPGPLAPDASGEVLKVCGRVRPWLGRAGCWRATSALELPAGQAAVLELQVGDRLRLEAA